MKTISFVLLLFSFAVFAQTGMEAKGGEYVFNPDNIPCITPDQHLKISARLEIARASLVKKGVLPVKHKAAVAPPKFIIPVRKAANAPFNQVWALSNFVDHDTGYPNKLQDYNCGTRTYDESDGYNHTGTDFYTWPFWWYQFENDLSEVVASAPGNIIYKHDGEFDMSCDFNDNQWNAVYIEHSDGSTSWYGHLKKGTLTSKNVGETVAAGEYLGVVGSSGNSTGPHLHFEVYDNNDNLVDPFSGDCNPGSSWWQNQPAYREPTVNALLIHNAEISFNTCPETETTNISNQFLPNTTVITAAYFKDQLAGTSATFNLYKPNGEISHTRGIDFTDTYGASYWYWEYNNLSDLGEWTFECIYQGKTVQQKFNVVSVLNVAQENLNKLQVAPNPAGETLRLLGGLPDWESYQMSLYNTLGQEIYKNATFAEKIDLGNFSKGLYYLRVYNNLNGASKTFSVLKR